MPTPAFYGGDFPTAERLAVVRGTSDTLPGLGLPAEVRASLPAADADAIIRAFARNDVLTIKSIDCVVASSALQLVIVWCTINWCHDLNPQIQCWRGGLHRYT
jgi:hypothetical protein